MAQIRPATAADLRPILAICSAAFPEAESGDIQTLCRGLMSYESNPETVILVADLQGRVVGYVMFSPVFDQKHQPCGYILAPLAVRPDKQKLGLGRQLVEAGKTLLQNAGVDALLVYGDPEYYGRFGFHTHIAQAFVAPYPLEFPTGWQALWLTEAPATPAMIHIRCVPPLMQQALW